MQILHLKRMYLPALSIVAVVFLLLLLIGISTYQNLDREEKRFLEFLRRQGLTLIDTLEAGARTGAMMPMWTDDAVAALLKEVGRNPDVAHVFLFDRSGTIVHHSNPALEGEKTDWQPSLEGMDGVRTRVGGPAGEKIYELAKEFSPSGLSLFPQGRMGHMMGSHLHWGDTLVLGLKMTAFEAAQEADLHHALVMAAILMVLGSGTFFFIFVIQNYYLVDKTLAETQDYTRQVIANMANGLLSIDSDGKIVSYNQLAVEYLGITESRIRGMDLRNVLDFRDTGIEQTISTCGSSLDREIRYRKPTGEIMPLALSSTPLRAGEERCVGVVIVLRDLRQIKHLEERVRRSEKLAAVGKLAAGIAHEIRNPLSSIRGFAQFLTHALSKQPQDQEYARVMVREVDRINRVVTDLLTFARPVEIEPSSTDLVDLIHHTMRLVESDAASKNVELRRKVPPGLRELMLDSNQITQALLNLVLNALQSVGSGGTVEIGAGLTEDRSRLHIWVQDDGPGVATELMEKIFDPFFTTREQGTGLGLAIVHKIAENHHGEVRVESPAPGSDRGARFTMVIPL